MPQLLVATKVPLTSIAMPALTGFAKAEAPNAPTPAPTIAPTPAAAQSSPSHFQNAGVPELIQPPASAPTIAPMITGTNQASSPSGST